MKHLCLALTALSCAWVLSSARAQPADEEGEPLNPPPIEHKDERHDVRSFLESLPPEMRERFRAAREKALEDPKLQELRKNAERANKEFFKAMRERMLKIDPELAEIVKKRAFERKAWKTWRDDDGGAGFGSLTVAEREQLISAMEKASKDPAVQAAKERKRDAMTSQERRTASQEYRRILQDAMIKMDPSVGPILDKMSVKRPQPPAPGGTE
jgi:hypothetical protein